MHGITDISPPSISRTMPLIIVPFFSPITPRVRIDRVEAILQKTGCHLESPESLTERISLDSERSHQKVVLFIGSGGTETDVTVFINESGLSSPFILVSYPENNSLPASMEIRKYLEMGGNKAVIVHRPINDLTELLQEWNRFSDALERIQASRIGMVGVASSWLIASEVDPEKVKEKWGADIVQYDLSVLDSDAIFAESDTICEELVSGASTFSVPKEEVRKAARLAALIMSHAKQESLDAVTVQCFDFYQRSFVTGCIALSYVNDQAGLSAGCEGDLPATFSMLLAKVLTGLPSFMANVTDVDQEAGTATFSHCTIATSLASSYDLMTHFETGQSVGIRGRLDNQPVTVFKVHGDDLSSYWVAKGSIQGNLQRESNCRTQVLVKLDGDVSYFLRSSLANHHIIILGDHAQLIRDFFAFFAPSD
jgi:L-fucose isomerase-like protein